MKRTAIGLLVTMTVLTLAAWAVSGFEADFEVSTYNPDVAELVNFEVCEPCLGESGTFHYAWDFDSDGIAELETDDPVAAYGFASDGYHQVTLTVTAAGQVRSRRKGVLVGPTPAYAVRELIEQENGTVFVLITIHVESAVPGSLGFVESMPDGWQLEIVDPGGATTKRNAGEKQLEVFWMMSLDAGAELTFSYRLHRSYASELPLLEGELSGYSEGRFAGAICGDLEMPN